MGLSGAALQNFRKWPTAHDNVAYSTHGDFVNFLFFTTTWLFYGAGICARPFWLLGGSEYREQIRMSSSSSSSSGSDHHNHHHSDGMVVMVGKSIDEYDNQPNSRVYR